MTNISKTAFIIQLVEVEERFKRALAAGHWSNASNVATYLDAARSLADNWDAAPVNVALICLDWANQELDLIDWMPEVIKVS